MYSFGEAHVHLVFLPRFLLCSCSSAEDWDFPAVSCFSLCLLGAGIAVMQDLLGSSVFFWDVLYRTAEQILVAAYSSLLLFALGFFVWWGLVWVFLCLFGVLEMFIILLLMYSE